MNNEIDKLNKMRQNGVISDDEYLVLLSQKQTEQRHNQNKPTLTPEQKKKHILYAIVFLGLFCILTGLGLMIAANWEMIPAFVKIAGGLVTLSGALIGAAYAGSRNNRLMTEACLFVAFCLVGGNIALVQQVYHLQLSFAEGSLLWWVLTLPLLPFTRLKILMMASVALLGFGVWDYLTDLYYMSLVGVLFVLMLLTLCFSQEKVSWIRHLLFWCMVVILYIGDIHSGAILTVLGPLTTTGYLIVLSQASTKTEEGQVRFWHYTFLFAAYRILLLFWTVSHDMMTIGLKLVVFGTVLLLGGGLYYASLEKVKAFVRRLVVHEK